MKQMNPRRCVTALCIVYAVTLIGVCGCGDQGDQTGGTAKRLPGPPDIDRDQQLAILQLNYCAVSLSRMVAYNNRIVLDDEYRTINTNLRLDMIKDQEFVSFKKDLLGALNRFSINETERERLQNRHDKKARQTWRNSVSEALGGSLGINPLSIITNTAMSAARAAVDYSDRIDALKDEHDDKLWELKKDELIILTELRKDCLQLSWDISREYKFPDKLRLTEKEADDLVAFCKERDLAKRARIMESHESDYLAYPPFWYYLGDAYQKSGRTVEALKAYDRYDDLYQRQPIFRRDSLSGLIAMNRIVLDGTSMGENERRKLLCRIQENLPDDGDAIVFCAAQDYILGDAGVANDLLRRCVDEGHAADGAVGLLTVQAAGLRKNRAELDNVCKSLAAGKATSVVAYMQFLGAIDDAEAVRRLWPKLSRIRACLEWHREYGGLRNWNELKVNFPSEFPPDELTVEVIIDGNHADWAEGLLPNSSNEIPFKLKNAWSYIKDQGKDHDPIVGCRFKESGTEYTLNYSFWNKTTVHQRGANAIDELPLIGVSIGSRQIVKP